MTSRPAPDPRQFWEDRYRDSDRIWSGRPNPLLVREVSDLTPGSALDLGCGEGADVVWLATRGWQVTGVDISQTALDRAAAHAAAEGVAEHVRWERHELGCTFPEGAYDLVSAQFLQSPVALDQDRVLRRAAGAVVLGGTLLVVMHGGWPSWHRVTDQSADTAFPTFQQVLNTIALPSDAWHVETLEAVERPCPSPTGHPGTRRDNIWRLTRIA
ncbi:class I SAM-dependent methyltransferase [Streptomyces sp. 11x1]|uniref:class I SAM-dependent methyltransferase n=1 Tax=Streptomyces sp. 11x1 TaxID=3038642 RepID=UPI00292E8ADA|nr:class I SAM-dependent methyltransferase [Streptomyces sp. 11x1]WNZ06383.1 class I SAM-dependent methyltransferase [Streptomyces sp. 11x1]